MKKLYIVGAGGFGREVFTWASHCAAHQRDWVIAGFLDDHPEALTDKPTPVPWIDRPGTFPLAEDAVFIVAIGNPAIRRQIHCLLRDRGARFVNVIHPTVVLGVGVELGCGIVLAPHAVVSAHARLGDGTVLNLQATVQHDAVVGPWSQVSCHADIGGGAILGAEVLVGTRASVGPRVRVGDGVRIPPATHVDADLASAGPGSQLSGWGQFRKPQNCMDPTRIYLSPPHLEGNEGAALQAVLESGWIAPAGPALGDFEQEFCRLTGVKHAVALTSCTAAIHLALLVAGVQPGDEVLCSSFSFAASANPIRMVGAEPVFIDSEESSWNLDPALLEEAIEGRIRATGRPPKALVLVHIFGQSADLDPISALCERHGVILIEDAAEALGAVYHSRERGDLVPGTIGRIGTFSFNGNKIITSSGGGMLVTADPDLAARALFLATQARDPAPHYQHSTLGFNYRLSNVLAALGRAQLTHLPRRVAARRAIFDTYQRGLGSLPGIAFMPEPAWSRGTRWLSCLTVDPQAFGASRDQVCQALASENIEARPVWKPLHLQPLFAGCPTFGGAVSEAIFQNGLCLPSGSNLTPAHLERILRIFRRSGGHPS